jgi:hypothetical protein
MNPEPVSRKCSTGVDLFEWGLDGVKTTTGRGELIAFCKDHNVHTLYVDSEALINEQVGATQQMLKDLLIDAGAANIGVELLFGRAEWADPTQHAYVVDLMKKVATFVKTLPDPPVVCA